MKKLIAALIILFAFSIQAQPAISDEDAVVVTSSKDAESMEELKKEIELMKKVYNKREEDMKTQVDLLRKQVDELKENNGDGNKSTAGKKNKTETPDNQYDTVDEEQKTLYDFDQRFSVNTDKPAYNFDWSFNMQQEFHWWNNTDLRTLNTESDTEIRYTDDQMAVAFTRAKIDAEVTIPDEGIGLELSWGFDGVWGHDQLQGFANPGTRIGRANVFWNFLNGSFASSTLTVGRQYFSVGGIPNDYMQKDILDAIVLDGKFSKLLEARFLLLDVYSGANNYGSDDGEVWNDEFQYFTRDDSEVTSGLNGDVSTYRWGAIFSFKEFVANLMPSTLETDPRLYAYYARVRGNGGGSDRSENGTIGNFSDNDWSAMGGARVATSVKDVPMLDSLLVYVDGAMSAGQDIKRDGEPDADYIAFAGGLGAQAWLDEILFVRPFVELDAFVAQGPKYDYEGNLISHGFVSFKGDEIGGLLFRRYWGVHPSAYVDDDGIDETPFSANRKSGLFMMHGGGGAEVFKKHTLRLDYWFTMDTGSIEYRDYFEANIDDLASANPYKSKAELEALKRLGKVIGHEVNLAYSFEPNRLLSYTITGAVFIPGSFFDEPIEDAASTIGVPKGTGSDAFFYGMAFGTELHF